MSTLNKYFDLKEIKYAWLLIFSMAAFVAALFFNRVSPEAFTKVEVLVYGAVFLAALLWGILNYAGHIKLCAVYRKFDSVENFTKHLSMDRDEKEELAEYLNDFVRDMEENGKSHEEAVKTAISQFQVKEIIETERDVLETKPHYYLLGYTVVFVAVILLIQGINMVLHLPFLILAASFMLMMFSLGFVGLFFIYRLADMAIASK